MDAVLEDDGGGVASSGSGRNVKRSRWLEGIFRGVAIDSGTVAPLLEPPRTPTVPVLTPVALQVDSASHSAAAVAAAMVQRLELSFSSLFDYQWCPHRYYLRKVVKLPSFPSPAMSYGKGSSGVIGRCHSCRSYRLGAGPTPLGRTAILETCVIDANTRPW